MEYLVEERTAGKTVLEVMKRELGISSALLKHLKFTEGGILVDGRHVTVRYVLRQGERLSLATDDREPGERLIPVCLPLRIAYEDEDVAVPDKPPDMPTHPSCGHHEDTVANALAYHYQEQGIPFVFRPVNRLDRNTSGLLLIARNRIAAGTLYRAMRGGQIRKLYLAILEGEPKEDEGLLETYMRRTAESVILRENCGEGEGGDLARTRYRVLARREGVSLVCAVPLTGRTHQLRVHFAGIGCPLLGDELYGTPSPHIGRHALHSCVLSFPRPSDGERVVVTSPMPPDMTAAAEALLGIGAIDPETLLSCLEELTACDLSV
ncbi:MAG: RluA family pseudouridine synthase [Clostridia bacterium]|nr:RluA family pseudouridine synthase [Clostridia bacterium]